MANEFRCPICDCAQTERERVMIVLRALVEAVDKHDRAAAAFRSPTAKEGAGQDLWAAESNLGQVVHEAQQTIDAYPEGKGVRYNQEPTKVADTDCTKEKGAGE